MNKSFLQKLLAYRLLISFIVLANLTVAAGSEQLKLVSLEFSGNKIIQSRVLKKLFLTRESGFFHRAGFNQEIFEADLQALVKFYHNQGYLEAQVLDVTTIPDSSRQDIYIVVQLVEGVQSFIDNIAVSDDYSFQSPAIHKRLKCRRGQAFNQHRLNQDVDFLLKYLGEMGYITATVQPELHVNRARHQVSIRLLIRQGPRLKIGTIKFFNIKSIHPAVIQRELLVKSGEFYNINRIEKTRKRLKELGLFRNVQIQYAPAGVDSPGVYNLFFIFEERENGELNFGCGYGSEDKFRLSVELFHKNFMGHARQIGARTSASHLQQRIEFSFTEPWLFNRYTKFDFTLFAGRQVQPNYQLAQLGGRMTFSYQFNRITTFTLAFHDRNVKLSEIRGHPNFYSSIGKTRSLTVSFIRDSRNNLMQPTKGSYANCMYESAGGFLKGTNAFQKLHFELRKFIKLHRFLIVAAAVQIGCGRGERGGWKLPLEERFYAGGGHSIRGFQKREVGPAALDGAPTGGNMLLIEKFELRFPLKNQWSLLCFSDMGNVYGLVLSLRQTTLRKTAGFGLRYHSPVGIARLDVGFKLNPKPHEDWGRIHFSFGHAF